MDCDTARQALSARIDGEREPIPAVRVDEHLAECDACSRWQAAAVGQTQLLKRLAGRSQLSEVRAPPEGHPSRLRTVPGSWPRWALGAVALIQLALAVSHGLGGGHSSGGGHVHNESIAWSAALGVAMLAGALRPAAALGLAWVLGAFTLFLVSYEVADVSDGRITATGPLTHLPVAAGAILALLLWRHHRHHQPERPPAHPEAVAVTDGILLPDKASRGRRRGHLRSTDGSAA